MKVLLVDDDIDLLDVTAYALRREGFNVILAKDGAQAEQRWQADQPDVVVLDVNLPDASGFDLCRTMRKRESTPVILLTALHNEEHIVQGFQAGADDYVTKPFSPRQLALRIRAVGRRGERVGEPELVQELRVGDLVLNLESHEVQRNNQAVQLTPIEFRLLYMLASNAGRVISATRLVDYAWNYERGDASLLKTHISHIRSKLQLPRSGVGSIQALPRVGYRLIAATGVEQ